MKSIKSMMTPLVIMLLFIVLGPVSCVKKVSPRDTQTKKNFVPVIRTDISSSVEEEGEIAPYKTVEVKASMSGRIIRILINEGDYISRGQVIAEIEADREQARSINSVVNTCEDARINYEGSLRDFEQNRELFKQGFIPEQTLSDSSNKYVQSWNKYKAAKEDYDLTRDEMGKLTNMSSKTQSVTAPLSGIVIKNNVEEGELVSGETSTRTGTVLFTVGDNFRLVVNVTINEFDIDRIQHYQTVEISRGQKTVEKYRGKVFKIAPIAETKDDVKVYPVSIEIANPSKNLRFGMSVSVKINIDSRSNVLAIPVTSLFVSTDKTEYAVLKKPDGTTEDRSVSRGINNDFYVEIRDGLEEGDLVLNQDASKPQQSRNNQRTGGGGMMNPMAGGGR